MAKREFSVLRTLTMVLERLPNWMNKYAVKL